MDLDSMQSFQIFQSTMGLRSIDSIHDEALEDDKHNIDQGPSIKITTSSNNMDTVSSKHTKTIKPRRNNGLTLQVEPDPEISKHRIKQLGSPLVNNCLLKAGLKKIPEEESMDLSRNKSFYSDVKIKGSGNVNKSNHLDEENSKVSSLNNTDYVPIKNSFFSQSNVASQGELDLDAKFTGKDDRRRFSDKPEKQKAINDANIMKENSLNNMLKSELSSKPLESLSGNQIQKTKFEGKTFTKLIDLNIEDSNKENVQMETFENSEEQRKLEIRKSMNERWNKNYLEWIRVIQALYKRISYY